MNLQRKVRLFRNGRNQAVRIPREFELPGDEAIMHREGDRLIIERGPPAGPNARLLAILADIQPLASEDAFPELEDTLPEPVEL
ncbi:MAG: twitching motility protein PilT [Caulobacteraceae bacterium]|nr:twitching motility protein PilT [Caulobacteraceae bacterium]